MAEGFPVNVLVLFQFQYPAAIFSEILVQGVEDVLVLGIEGSDISG
jgi:hypothetical protein